MSKVRLTTFQIFCISVLFWEGSSLVSIRHATKQDHWLALLMAGVIFLPLLLVFMRLLKMNPGKTLFDIITERFGALFGKIVVALYTLYIFIFGALFIRNYTQAVTIIALPETPQLMVSLMCCVSGIYLLKKGLRAIGRFSALFFLVTTAVLIFTLITAVPSLNTDYLYPMLATPFHKMAEEVSAIFSFPFSEAVILLAVLPFAKTNPNTNKAFFGGFAAAYLIILVIALRDILVLGGNAFSSFYFPSFESANFTKIGQFIQRLEALTLGFVLISSILKFTLCVFAGCQGLAKLVNMPDGQVFFAPAALMCSVFSLFIYGQISELQTGLQLIQAVALPFQVLFPIALFICSAIALHMKKSRQINAP